MFGGLLLGGLFAAAAWACLLPSPSGSLGGCPRRGDHNRIPLRKPTPVLIVGGIAVAYLLRGRITLSKRPQILHITLPICVDCSEPPAVIIVGEDWERRRLHLLVHPGFAAAAVLETGGKE